MKISEYEALREMRAAILRAIAEEIAAMLREHVELNAERLVREHYLEGAGALEP